jgi:hypothetical protein
VISRGEERKAEKGGAAAAENQIANICRYGGVFFSGASQQDEVIGYLLGIISTIPLLKTFYYTGKWQKISPRLSPKKQKKTRLLFIAVNGK